MVNFTINSIDVPRHLMTAEHSEALTSTHRERCAPGRDCDDGLEPRGPGGYSIDKASGEGSLGPSRALRERIADVYEMDSTRQPGADAGTRGPGIHHAGQRGE